MGDVDLETAVAELYALGPQEFLPRRTALSAQARSDGDRELGEAIRRLRKPSVAAWAVNRMVQGSPELVARLTDLAERLRAAQQSLDGAALPQLGRERSALVDALVKATAEGARQAGTPLSAPASRDAADTFVAALASAEAAEAVTSGRLTRTLSYAGFGDVDLDEATARPLRVVRDPGGVPPAAGPDGGQAASGAEASGGEASGARAGDGAHPQPAAQPDAPDPRLAEAQQRLREAMAAATAAAHRRSVLSAELELADNRVSQLSREIARARAHRDTTADALAAAEVADEQAQARTQAARDALDALRPPDPGSM